MRDSTLIKEKTLERGGEEFTIGDVYLTEHGEFYIELKKNGTRMNMRIQDLKNELNSGRTKLKMNA